MTRTEQGEARIRRIYGLETEYGLTSRPRGERRVGPEEIARQMFRGMIAWGRSSNVFLGNGSRIYLDVGSHPEYATAECDDLLDLVAHDAVGNRLVYLLANSSDKANFGNAQWNDIVGRATQRATQFA